MRYRNVILVWAIVTLRFVQIKTQDESDTKKPDKDELNKPKEGEPEKPEETGILKLEGDLNKPEETVVQKIEDGELDKPEETVMRNLEEGEPKMPEESNGPDEIEKAKPTYRTFTDLKNILSSLGRTATAIKHPIKGLADMSKTAFNSIISTNSHLLEGGIDVIKIGVDGVASNIIGLVPDLAPLVLNARETIHNTADIANLAGQTILTAHNYVFNRTADAIHDGTVFAADYIEKKLSPPAPPPTPCTLPDCPLPPPPPPYQPSLQDLIKRMSAHHSHE
ncbi:unnamed protein product [Nezara viridula]|uniref:Neuropeptide n=1 Tax=Nezara viridula TaxID=85310 RepID=A0A9P0HSP8_NEZVI|nr:unnamed protein product [Nezara viridula]